MANTIVYSSYSMAVPRLDQIVGVFCNRCCPSPLSCSFTRSALPPKLSDIVSSRERALLLVLDGKHLLHCLCCHARALLEVRELGHIKALEAEPLLTEKLELDVY